MGVFCRYVLLLLMTMNAPSMVSGSFTMSFSLTASRLAVLLLLSTPSAALWKSSTDQESSGLVEVTEGITKGNYGVDCSFPIHRERISTNYAWLPHNLDPTLPTPDKFKGMPVCPFERQKEYEQFIAGCVEKFKPKGKRCLQTESDRVAMSLRQPQSMQNYTELGFKKIKTPPALFSLIAEFFERNRDKGKLEQWGIGNTYTNNWESQSEMISVEDSSLRGGGYQLKQKIWNSARNVISEWTGEELTQCSLYGIRVYKEGAVLATHVDRLPLVSSAIINVAQDVDEPWPLEVIGHDGVAYNVTMEPGDMVLYESHSVLHGRPYPLKGRYFANIFIHFEPTGHSLRHNARVDEEHAKDVDTKYREALERGSGGHENEMTNGLPPYIIPGTPEESHWRAMHPDDVKAKKKKQQSFTTGSTPAHKAAQIGDTEELLARIKENKDLVNAKDENGWTPLVESARGGHLEAVKLLVEHGADINHKTYGSGGTALWWARQVHGDEHPVIAFLEEMGALEAGPEL